MKEYKALIKGVLIASNVKIAESFLKRLVGLLTHKKLNSGEGLLISHCKQVHTFGMRFRIDVIFLSETGEIIYVENDMRSGNISKYIKKAYQVLELKSGAVQEYNIKSGDIIIFE